MGLFGQRIGIDHRETAMYFKNQLPPDADYTAYKQLLEQLAQFVVDCIGFPMSAHDIAMHASYGDGKMHHATILMLTRHFCEQIDGLAVLAGEGCAEPGKPLIRSAFEASLGVHYVLHKDSERRGLAYQVAHAHQRISLYRKLDPTDESGKQLRKEIAGDSMGEDILQSLMHMPYQKWVANLVSGISKPPLDVIDLEWKRTKKKIGGYPNWFSLFDGPRTIRGLAKYLGKAFWYEFLYSDWSGTVHAGTALSHMAKNANEEGGPVVIRPLRHPDGLQSQINLAVGMCLELTRSLLGKYGSEQQREDMRAGFIKNIQSRWRHLSTEQLISASWK